MKAKEIFSVIEAVAPLNAQESYDNSGLLFGSPEQEVKGVLVCLDVTPAVIQEAIDKNCNLVISHHPFIFRGLKNIRPETISGGIIYLAAKHEICIYAAHTNLDNSKNGVNRILAEKLGLTDLQILQPQPSNSEIGAGMIGFLPEGMEEKTFLTKLKQVCGTPCVRHTALLGKKIQKIAVCGGSGSFLIEKAIIGGADVFVTGDLKYHEFSDINRALLLVDVGHFESEQFAKEILISIITKNFTTFAVHFSEKDCNPIFYHI